MLKIYIYFCWAGPGPPLLGWTGLSPRSSPTHINRLLYMSTVTSFTSPAETCTVHVLHGKGRNESKRGGGFT